MPTFPATARQKVANPCGERNPPGSYDVFYGPFDSWLNVKEPPADLLPYMTPAVGDGITDDTDAIQSALDFCGRIWTPLVYLDWASQVSMMGLNPAVVSPNTDPGLRSFPPGQAKSPGPTPDWTQEGTYVVYLPAGTYRITRTLRIYNRRGFSFYGEDPRTTKLLWDGADWQASWGGNWSDAYDWSINESNYDMLLLDGGGTECSIRRITLEGQNRARIALNFSTGGWWGGAGAELAEVLDCYIHNCGLGIQAGGYSGGNDADVPVKRCQFWNVQTYGIITNTWNALNWRAWDSLFVNCGQCVASTTGSIAAINNLFINSISGDLYQATGFPTLFRGNTCIITKDATIHGNDFIQALGGGFTPNMVQGNLVIHAQGKPLASILKIGCTAVVDNALYDSDYLTGSSTGHFPIVTAIGGPENGSVYNFFTGEVKEPFYTPHFVSGNIYNGHPDAAVMNPGPDTYGNTISTNPGYLIDQTIPAQYVPRNYLGITDSEIRHVLNANSDSPIIQNIIDRMPVCPDHINPADSAKVRLTDIDISSTPSQIDSAIANAVTNASDSHINLIHFPWSGVRYGYATAVTGGYTLPAGVSWVIIGDGSGSMISYVWQDWMLGYPGVPQAPTPIFTVGSTGATKLRLEDIYFNEDTYAKDLIGVQTGTLAIYSSDNGRLYADFFEGAVIPQLDPAIGHQTSYCLISGFEHLRARWDMYNGTGIECRGTGVIHTSDDNTVVRMFGLTPSSVPGRERGGRLFYVSNGGSIHVYDNYSESQKMAWDLRGGNGYVVNENYIRYHFSNDPGWNPWTDDAFACRLENFTGHQMHLGFMQSWVRPNFDVPTAGSDYTAWGMLGEYSSWLEPWDSLVGLPSWSVGPIDASVLFGLNPAATVNSTHLHCLGNQYQLGFTYPPPPSTTILAQDMDASQTYLIIGGDRGTFPATAWGAFQILIDDELMNVNWAANVGDDWWDVMRGSTPVPHAAGTTIYSNFWTAVQQNCLNFPTSQTPGTFVMPPMAIDALRYRPFPLPSRIDDKAVTDIVMHRFRISSHRPYSITVIAT